jgi:hypothetical protein
VLDARAVLEEALAIAEDSGDVWLLAEAMAQVDVDWALRVARRIPLASERWTALSRIAVVVAPSDPDRALRIVGRIRSKAARMDALPWVASALVSCSPELAIAVVNGVESHVKRQSALYDLVEPMATEHPQTAHQLAASLKWPWNRAEALRAVAAAYGSADTGRALEVAEEAVAAAKAQDNPHDIAHVLVDIVETLVSVDVDRASEVAEMAFAHACLVVASSERDCVFDAIAQAVARYDEERALDASRQIEDGVHRGHALTEIAAAVAETHPERTRELVTEALDIASGIDDESWRGIIEESAVEAAARVDPREAMELALTLGPEAWSVAGAACQAAEALTASDPDRAVQLGMTAQTSESKAVALTGIVWGLKDTDPERALAVARLIEVEDSRTAAMFDVVEPLARVDPQRALEVARSLPGAYWRVLALSDLAEVRLEVEPE